MMLNDTWEAKLKGSDVGLPLGMRESEVSRNFRCLASVITWENDDFIPQDTTSEV